MAKLNRKTSATYNWIILAQKAYLLVHQGANAYSFTWSNNQKVLETVTNDIGTPESSCLLATLICTKPSYVEKLLLLLLFFLKKLKTVSIMKMSKQILDQPFAQKIKTSIICAVEKYTQSPIYKVRISMTPYLKIPFQFIYIYEEKGRILKLLKNWSSK